MSQSAIIFLFVVLFAASTLAGNNYNWGETGEKDILIAKDTVKKRFIFGLVVSKKYVFKQKETNSQYTITSIKVKDNKKKKGATAELLQGGPGSKGCTIKFKSQRGYGINDVVLIYGRL